MNCHEFENALAEVLDSERLSAVEKEHMAHCERCSRLASQLELIAGKAKQLANVEPAVDLWPRIRVQLEKEGIIRNNPNSGSFTSASSSTTRPKMVYSFPTSRTRM